MKYNVTIQWSVKDDSLPTDEIVSDEYLDIEEVDDDLKDDDKAMAEYLNIEKAIKEYIEALIDTNDDRLRYAFITDLQFEPIRYYTHDLKH